ncbi:hypothetical protein ACFL6B_04585 [Thermodesulfobacteriota bacterium]
MAKPEKVFKNGACEAAVFVNEINKNGTPIQIKKVSVQRRYKDRDGKWQGTSSFDINDIPKAVMVLAKAYDYLTDKNNNNVDFVP